MQNAARLGRVAERYSDQAIITSVHCRGKAPLELAHRVLDGCDHVHKPMVSPNRRRAIAWALQQAGPGDAVLVSGCQPQPPTINGVVREPREVRWCRETLQEEPPRARHEPAIYPIWRYRKSS